MKHSSQTGVRIHVPHAFEYADATARAAATGFVPEDVGKLSLQLDDFSFWVLSDDDPATWVAVGGAGYYGRSHIEPWFYDDISGSWSFSDNNPTLYKFYYVASSIGDYLEYLVPLSAGTYSFSILAPMNGDLGKAELKIDGDVVATIDLYAGSLAWNQIITETGIVVATSGIKTIRLEIITKNPSSSGNSFPWNSAVIRRTS